MPKRALAKVLLLAAMVVAVRGTARADGTRRFALFVGNDRGGRDTRPLLYATADARRMRDVFVRLGDVRDEEAPLLLDATARDVLGALDALERRVREAAATGARTALLVYYSGHAKDGDLRLGDTRLPLEALRARVGASGADVRIAIVDSCRSGAVTRTKGARRAPAFAIESTGPEVARGTVFLTSSAFDEDSQESDEVGGSYFTHHLTNGLQGEADRSADGRVTLAEAYAYAYARTVADTAESSAGAQHPTFSYDLKGHADLVLTAYASRAEGLYLPAAAPAGTYYLVDARRTVAAEVAKQPGVDRRVAIAPGRYKVKRRLPDRLRVGEVVIPPGQLVALEEGTLRDTPFSDDPVKGASPIEAEIGFGMNVGAAFQSFFDEPTRESLFPGTGLVAIELAARDFFRRGWVLAGDFAAGGTRGTLVTSSTLPFQFSTTSLGGSVTREWELANGALVPFVGARFAFVFMKRVFDDATLPEQTFSTFSPGLVLGLRVRLGEHWAVLARSRVHYLLYNVDENRSLGYFELAAALGYDF